MKIQFAIGYEKGYIHDGHFNTVYYRLQHELPAGKPLSMDVSSSGLEISFLLAACQHSCEQAPIKTQFVIGHDADFSKA